MKFPQFRMLMYYLLGLIIMGITSWLMSGAFPVGPALVSIHWFVALLPAILLMIFAVVLHCRAGSTNLEWAEDSPQRWMLYRISYLLNAISSGLAVGALVADKGILLTEELVLALIPAIALGMGLFLLFLIPNRIWRIIIVVVFMLLSVLLVIGGLGIWLDDGNPMGCAMLFSGLFFLAFPVGSYIAIQNPKGWHRYLSFTGFGAAIIILLVVVFILSEGEILDGLDFDFGGGEKSKKKQPK